MTRFMPRLSLLFRWQGMSGVTRRGRGLVVGCGSNVMDLFFPLRRFPQAGDKTYFANGEQFCASRIVGGVTLNHLAWARALGCPTALMALQGNDENGREIRKKLTELGVSIEHIRTSDAYVTSVSHILSTPDGERTILMAPASTSCLVGRRMEQEFRQVINGSSSSDGAPPVAMVTTEISQVPLSGVRYLIEASRRAGIPSLLDVDVPPEVALTSAELGCKDDLVACVTQASVLKLTRSAGSELLSLVSSTPLDSTLEGASRQLAEVTKCQLCVITDGSRGSALALGGGSKVEPVRVDPHKGITQVDATGAGDAFFGGIIACLYASGGLPQSERELRWMGSVASAAGAACVEVKGALPVLGRSAERVLELCPEAEVLARAADDMKSQSLNKAAGAPSPPSGPFHAFLTSLQADSDAAVSLAVASAARSGYSKSVERAVELLSATGKGTGHTYTSGVGKSGLVASRMAASLRSIGIRASYVPGGDWSHGCLGTVRANDVLIAFSHSGATVEMVGAARWFKAGGAHVVAVTGKEEGGLLAEAADAHLIALASTELRGIIPTRSIIAQEAVVNGLLTAVSDAMGLTVGAFKRNHPGGSIGTAAPQQSPLP